MIRRGRRRGRDRDAEVREPVSDRSPGRDDRPRDEIDDEDDDDRTRESRARRNRTRGDEELGDPQERRIDVPTWMETVTVFVDANIENHKKTKGGGRGRGGRRR